MRHATLAVLVAAAAASACGGSTAQSAPEAPRGVPVRTVAVERRDLEDTLVLTGTLRPRGQVQVVAEVAARLTRIIKDEGASVADGDVLATLDETDTRLAQARAKAALDVAEANRAHAVVEKERADNLVKTGGITDKDNLAAQVNLQVADAARAQAKAEADIVAQALARCTVRAPFAGRVAKRHVDPGALLPVGTPMFTLVDDGVMEFRASVPSGEYGRVRVGSTVDVTVDSLPGLKAKGHVVRVTPWVEERTRTFEAVVQLPGGRDLVGGLFARAAVHVGGVAGAVVVPPGVLQRDGAKPKEAAAFVVEGGKAHRRTVTLGVEEAAVIQVTQGLAAGDVVILDPPVALGDGASVEIQKAAAPQAGDRR